MKINAITEFGTSKVLGDKLIEVEKAKDGVLNVNLLNVQENTVPVLSSKGPRLKPIATYDIDYTVKSSRGQRIFNTRSAIFEKQLYILTAQCDGATYEFVKDTIQEVFHSLVFTS